MPAAPPSEYATWSSAGSGGMGVAAGMPPPALDIGSAALAVEEAYAAAGAAQQEAEEATDKAVAKTGQNLLGRPCRVDPSVSN